ncbi:MAG: citramalate synthase [Acidimicrobiia bacterium]|nr:citramalate synthase [Acidimicrobiia bacterium]
MTENARSILDPGPSLPARVEIFDTTLRDGSQREGLSLTVNDKLRIARHLDDLGIHYIEGGWPGANPKDDEFFRRAPTELKLEAATLVAFGSTRRAHRDAGSDDVLAALVEAGTDAVCIVGKSWDYHVTEALRVDLDEGIAMVGDSVAFLVSQGKEVLFDAEHFFDGWKHNRDYALEVVQAAAGAGAACLVLCDTNGGTLPFEVARVVDDVVESTQARVGVHFHDDADCAVANAVTAVRHGAEHVQGCLNGLGERTGNANLSSIIPNLVLKLGVDCIPRDRLTRLTPVSHAVAEIANQTLAPNQPYVGASAFAHKAGLHVSALARRPDAYEHVDPEDVGNNTRLVVSEMAGRATVVMKAQELGIDLEDDRDTVTKVLEDLKSLEHAGYHFEVADGSFELLIRSAMGWDQDYFRLESFRVIMEKRTGADGSEGGVATEATIKLWAGGERYIATAEGNGPVNALDRALRDCIGRRYPELAGIHLADYKVRVLDTGSGTAAVTRVLIDTTDGLTNWGTLGVHENIIEASWEALSESLVVGLLRAERLRSGGDESG